MDTRNISQKRLDDKHYAGSLQETLSGIKISIHPAAPNPTSPYRYNAGFIEYPITSLSDLASVTERHIWSPNVMSLGRRLKTSFLESWLAVLDFDDGVMTIAAAARLAAEKSLACIISPTKSHQREKVSTSGEVKPPCDRFRMIVLWNSPVRDLQTYEGNMRQLVRQLGADPSCVDGARYFFPSRQAVLIQHGHPLVWEQLPPSHPEQVKRKSIEVSYFRTTGRLPHWIQKILRDGHPVGGRHKAAYRLGASLAELGLPCSDILALVGASPLAAIGSGDLERAVYNGIRRVRGG
jgi:hypothetical protein